MNPTRILLLLLVVVTFPFVASACGGDEGEIAGGDVTIPDIDTATVVEDVDTERLRQEVDEIEQVVRDDVSRLSEARSLDDLSGELQATRSQLEESAGDLTEVDVSDDPELERRRNQLESAVRDLSAQLEEAEGAVAERDLERAVRVVSEVAQDRERVDSGIDEIRRELEERAGE